MLMLMSHLCCVCSDHDSHSFSSQVFLKCTYVTLVIPLSSDPAGTLCHRALNPPRGSIKKPLCEINPFLLHSSTLKWVAPLTASGRSPIYLEADWLSTSIQGIDKGLTVSTITRAPSASKELDGSNAARHDLS